MGSNYVVKISDVAVVFDGPHATPEKIDDGPYFLSISSLEGGILDLSRSAHLSDAQFIKWTKRATPQEGDVLFSYETRLGEAALMPAGVKACLGRRMGLLRPNLEKVIPEYLLYAFLSPKFQQEIKKRTIHGATVDRIALKEFPDFNIRIPPLDEQRRVVDILNSMNGKLTVNRQINQTLEQMAQALFKSWFVDFDPVVDNALDAGFFEQNLDLPDELLRRAEARQVVRNSPDFKPLPDATRQLFPAAFEACAEPATGLGGWLPQGWRPSNVGSEFDVTMGQSPPSSTYNEIGIGMPFFQGKTDFGFRFPSNRIYCSEPKRMAKKNDTLISVRAPVGDINLANEDCAIGRGIAAARHNSGSISFSYYAMNNLSKHFQVFEGEGTVFGSINQKDFKDLPLIKYPCRVISEFDKLCGHWDKRIEIMDVEISALSNIRDTLLPKLISGELQLDNIGAELATE